MPLAKRPTLYMPYHCKIEKHASVSAYAMNTFASTALQGLSPFELVFAIKPRHLSSFEILKITSFPTEYREFFTLLLE